MLRQRLQLRSRGRPRPDTLPDIILYGGAVELRLRTPSRPELDGRSGGRLSRRTEGRAHCRHTSGHTAGQPVGNAGKSGSIADDRANCQARSIR